MQFQLALSRLNACNGVAHAVASHQGTKAFLERKRGLGKTLVASQAATALHLG